MWFRRTARNRRLRREYVLDVKLRSSQVRAARMRLAAVALGVVFAAVLGVGLVWRGVGLALNHLVFENKAFALTTLDVQSDGIIPNDQLRRWAGVKAGENLLGLDLARVKRNLELVSLVQSVSVERVLPHTLRIRVIEREPLARVKVPKPRADGGIEIAVFHLDAEGYVILPLDPRQRVTVVQETNEPLPVVTGINPDEVQAGRRIETPQLRTALEWIAAFDCSPMAGLVELERVDISSPQVIAVTTQQGSEIIFGLADFDQQFRRWREIFEAGQKLGKAIATLDLALTNSIPARWLEASSVPAVSPKPPKTFRSKKRHV